MIEASLESRIKAVYPAGVIWERDDSQLDPDNHVARLQSFMDETCATIPLTVATESWSSPYEEIAFTSIDDPEFYTWVWTMDNAAKTQWIHNSNRPYVVLWVKASRVAGYYVTFFNHWRPRGDTGYLDADFREPPDDKWLGFSEVVFKNLHHNGFAPAPDTLLKQQAPFVLTWGGDKIPNDDPRWDDDNFEPDPVPATIHDCLFGDE